MKITRVLIADADDQLLRLYSRSLGKRGFQVETARDGLDCVARLRAFLPHVLVLAPDLPWGAGEGVLAMMYEDLGVPFVPVMALAARYPEDGKFCIGSFPVAGYAVKPLSPDAFEQCLVQFLRKVGDRLEPARAAV
jgi:DNA-binding response OmpR family regulator